MMKLFLFPVFLLIIIITSSSVCLLFADNIENKNDVAVRDSILLINTLDGSLHAVSQRTGLLKWTVEEEPILKMSPFPNITDDTSNTKPHLLLPDPKDGSLYLFTGSSNDKKHRTLEKLPFTVSELVATSPCRSSDGMIYTSKKTDEWMIVDLRTGQKVDVINVDSPVCPTNKAHRIPEEPDEIPPQDLLYLFKSEYQISIFNGETREKLLNFTFVDYSPSMISTISQNSYDFLHLASSTNGKMATIEMSNGRKSFLWSQQFPSPIVSMYKLTDGANFPLIHRVPFFTIGGHFVNSTNFFGSHLFPSVYVGELTSSRSLYALSALVENNQMRKDSDYLIGGPDNETMDRYTEFLKLMGYYEYPKKSEIKFSAIPKTQLIPSRAVIGEYSDQDQFQRRNSVLVQLDAMDQEHYFWLNNLILFLVGSAMLASFIIIAHYWSKRQNVIQISTNKSSMVMIGKITFDPADIIGRGCAGTCVYKGLFEDKQHVAVKRIVSDCFKLANREIDLLRKLQHPNLIRYFATERDQQFSYIAIELAQMTLADYVEQKKPDGIEIDKTDMLYQACQGVAHLHSLDIVHRDIKPQNILISLPVAPGQRRKIMITDFGMSKILSSDSMTTMEGFTSARGTEGWIAPEILRSKLSTSGTTTTATTEENSNQFKPSKPNDIFSLGCLIFYTYTNGKHPFGELFHRQNNILRGEYDLQEILQEDDLCLYSLVEPMISLAAADRPPIEVVLRHPFFWNAKQSLQFMQDVSDRFECESMDSEIVKTLEQGSLDVCRGDWRRCITIELQEDLRKFRSYKGSSVRDLLRAIRNKRHHYHELDEPVQRTLGRVPDEFVRYFTGRFPRLIIHSYIAMQCCSHEDLFQNYYHHNHHQNGGQENFKFKMLPRAVIRWNERWKNDDGKDPEIFTSIRQRTKKTPSPSTIKSEPVTSTTTPTFQDKNSEQKLLKVMDPLFYNDVFKSQ